MFTNPRFSQLQVDFNFLFSQLPSFDGEEIDGTRVNYEGLLFPRPHGINMPRSASSRLASRYHGFQGTGK